MRRLFSTITSLVLGIVALLLFGGSAQAQTIDPIDAPLSLPPDPPPVPADTSIWQLVAVAVCASLVTLAVVLMVHWVRTHHRHGPPLATAA